ncbi:signal recognition particle-docking protein FtsY [Candidatus Pacearchaeota archaeon ex4484_31]|nr:MAG: signal recognition particle-docking protein FtsY [Candidatus Pacearchaeota archaeon ex4484_31]
MFRFLKEKLSKLLKKTEKEIEKAAEAEKEKIEKEREKERKVGVIGKIKKIITLTKLNEEVFEKFFSEFEELLIENNVAIEAIDFLHEKLRKELVGKEIERKKVKEALERSLKEALSSLLLEPFDLIEEIKRSEKPYVIVFFGINGVGKTLTIAKIAKLLKKNKITVVLAASDTFRAAAIEQLEKHSNALNIKMIKHKYGADPAAVAFDAIKHAKARNIDCVLIDTAGRMHTKKDLMEEMKKICKVSKPNLKIFVAESVVGNDAIEQAKAFDEAVGIDCIVLTKFDVDEKGGACISIGYVTNKPILFLGTGQSYDDLKPFNKEEIINALFS